MKRRAFFTAAFGAIGALFARKTIPATKCHLGPTNSEPGVLGFSDAPALSVYGTLRRAGFSPKDIDSGSFNTAIAQENEYLDCTEITIGHIQAANEKRFIEARAEYLGQYPKIGITENQGIPK